MPFSGIHFPTEKVELSSFRLPLGCAIGLRSGPSVVPHLLCERTCIIQKSDCYPQLDLQCITSRRND